MSKIRTYKCTVPFCDTRANSGFSYLSTTDKAKREEWIEKLNLDRNVKSHRICPKHFQNGDFGFARVQKKKLPSKNIPVRLRIYLV